MRTMADPVDALLARQSRAIGREQAIQHLGRRRVERRLQSGAWSVERDGFVAVVRCAS
jgi:hypothetical protein